MYEAILFDFDGTLVDFVDSDIESLKWLHLQTGTTVCVNDFIETSVDEIMKFHNLVKRNSVDPLQLHEYRLKNTFARHAMPWDDNYVTLYKKKLINTCTPLEGVKKLLSKIPEKIKTGLVSNAYDGDEQRERIRHSGLENYFDIIVIAGDIGIYKPDPSIFLFALDNLGVVPDRALHIGDSIKYDVIGARSAGMKTALIGDQTNKGSIFADYVVENGVDGLQVFFDELFF